MNAPKVTILTPSYNRAHTLPRVFESLQKQTFKDFEWLIIDDGSTDNTKNIVPGLSDQGVWKHKTKKGEIIYASIFTSDLNFKGIDCRMVMATNITDSVVKEERIKSQNAALHEIAWLNSHEVRKSLCSVISLIQLTKDSQNELERRQYIAMMEQCTSELDEVLIKTNKRVDELKEHDSVQDPAML